MDHEAGSEDDMDEFESLLYGRVHYDSYDGGNEEPLCTSPVYTVYGPEDQQVSKDSDDINFSAPGNVEGIQFTNKNSAPSAGDLTASSQNSSNITKYLKSSDKSHTKNKNVLKNPAHCAKNAPFQRQTKKLNKVLLIQQKKAKAKQAQSKIVKSPIETIDLDSSDSSDDCIILPTKPPPVYTIDESDDEDSNVPSTSQVAQSNQKSQTQPHRSSSAPVYEANSHDNNDSSSDTSSDSSRPVPRLARVIHSSCSDLSDEPTTQIDLDSLDWSSGVEVTGIPYIVRGPAIEHNISNRTTAYYARSKRQSMCDATFLGKIDSLAKTSHLKRIPEPSDSSDDSEPENVPRRTPREIAENALKNLREASVAKRQKLDQGGNNSANESAGTSQAILTNQLPNGPGVSKVPNKQPAVKAKPAKKVKPKRSNTAQTQLEADSSNENSNDTPAVPNDANMNDILMHLDEFMTNKEKEAEKKRHDEENPPYVEETNEEIIARLPVDSDAIRPHTADGGVTYFVKHFYDQPTNTGVGWTEEMRRFYEKSWQGENFDVTEVTKRMNPDKRLWKINNTDYYDNPTSKRIKCQKCLEYGHLARDCKRPRRPLVCAVCGENGHSEPRCPNTICLRCAKKTSVFVKSCNICLFNDRMICALCKVRGHTNKDCPDKWRRYHSTIKPNEDPNDQVTYRRNPFCSVCGKRGHTVDYCRSYYNFMEYPASTCKVAYYTPSYRNSISLPGAILSACNLLYNPKTQIEFHMAEKSQANTYYGRYLNAVGLGSLLSAAMPAVLPKRRSAAPKRTSVRPKQSSAPRKCPSAPLKHSSFSISEEIIEDDAVIKTETVIPDAVVECESIMETEEPAVEDQAEEPPAEDQAEEPLAEDHDAIVEDFNNSTAQTDSSSTIEKVVSKMPPLLGTRGIMGATPDFIPIGDCSNDDFDPTIQTGISLKYCTPHVEQQESNDTDGVTEDAKIYLLAQHSKYILSPDGSEFLAKITAEHNIEARLEHENVGYTLIISGTAANQERFHTDVRVKLQELTQAMFRKTVDRQMVPRRVDSLIRVLRENINLLLADLGDVNKLYTCLQLRKDDYSRQGMKKSDKIRRIINMILIGQAGLAEGDFHFHKLVELLTNLMKNFDPTSNVPNQLRETIDKHFRMVFSPKPVDANYEQLIADYNSLVPNERFRNINVEITERVQKTIQCKTPKFAALHQNPKSQQISNQADPDAGSHPVSAPSLAVVAVPRAAKAPSEQEIHFNIRRLIGNIRSSFATPKKRRGSTAHPTIIDVMPQSIDLMERCVLLTKPEERRLKNDLFKLLKSARAARFTPKQCRMAADLHELLLRRSSP